MNQQLSIVPPVDVQLDLGEGRKTYGLRFTQFSIIALAQHGDLLSRVVKHREDGSVDADAVQASTDSLSLVEQAHYGAVLTWSMLVADHPHLKYSDLVMRFGPDELINVLPKAMEALTAALPEQKKQDPPKPKPKRSRKRKFSPVNKPSFALAADFGRTSTSDSLH